MRLQAFATEADVEEALRLFQVSTLNAAMTGSLAGMRKIGRLRMDGGEFLELIVLILFICEFLYSFVCELLYSF